LSRTRAINDTRAVEKKGQFTTDQSNVGRSLAADKKKRAKNVVAKGQGDKGDQKR
jgi:hypothetical protein